MLLVKNFLNTKSFKQLIDEHGVYASVSKCANKVSINYSQIESYDGDLLAQQCRGLILRKLNGTKFNLSDGKIDLNQIPGELSVVAYPFDRFFNNGMEFVNIDWSDRNLTVVEKLDGTLTIVYYDSLKSEWHVATRSVSEADVDQNGFTFRSLFELGLKESYNTTFSNFTKSLDVNVTYMFELTSFYNMVVVKYKQTSITLIGARNIKSFKELNIYGNELKIDPVINKVKHHILSNINDIVNYVSTTNPLESEGVVAYDSKFRRVKVKSAAYVSLHHTISRAGSSDRNLLTLILSGQDDDILSKFPEELANKLKIMKLLFINFIKYSDRQFSLIKEISERSDVENKRKEFSLLLSRYSISWTAPYFKVYTGNISGFLEFIEMSKSKSSGDWSDSFKDKLLLELEKMGLNV